jgi:hypothetical protein
MSEIYIVLECVGCECCSGTFNDGGVLGVYKTFDDAYDAHSDLDPDDYIIISRTVFGSALEANDE